MRSFADHRAADVRRGLLRLRGEFQLGEFSAGRDEIGVQRKVHPPLSQNLELLLGHWLIGRRDVERVRRSKLLHQAEDYLQLLEVGAVLISHYDQHGLSLRRKIPLPHDRDVDRIEKQPHEQSAHQVYLRDIAQIILDVRGIGGLATLGFRLQDRQQGGRQVECHGNRGSRAVFDTNNPAKTFCRAKRRQILATLVAI